MSKQVFRIRFFVFFLLSLIQISYSKSRANQIISEAPQSDQASTLSPENVVEPEFSPGRYPLSSPPPLVAKSLATEPEIDGYPLSSPPSVAETLPTEPETNDYNVSLSKSPAGAPLTDFPPPETKTEAGDYKAQVTAPEPSPSKVVIVPETNKSSAEPEANDVYNSPIKTSAPAPSIAIPSTETNMETTQVDEVGVSPAPNPSILPSKSKHATESLESVPSEDSLTLPENKDNSTTETLTPVSSQVAPPPVAAAVDEDVDMPTVSSNPYTYKAEDETVDIVHEENKDDWGSWGGQSNGVKVAGVLVGVCLIGLAGLVYNSKTKKKTKFPYHPLSKGIY